MAKIKLSGKRRALNIIVVVLSLCCFVIGAGCVYAETVLGKINYEKATSEDISNIIASGTTEFDFGNISSDNLYHDPAVMNFLLLGVDDYQQGDTGRSDTIMMMSVDTRHEEIKLTSYMRDSYVSIPGYSYDKLNHAYAYGGPSLTIATLEDNFRVDIDRYIVIDFSKFVTIIDTLGGIDLEITEAEAEVINAESGEDDSLALSAGQVHMTGKQARMYSRIRKIDTDYERTNRQRKVVTAVIEKMRSTDLLTLNGYLADILSMISTDMTKDDVLGLIANLPTYLNYNITTMRLPVDDEFYEWTSNVGGWVLVPYLEENIDILVKYIYGEDNIPELKSSYTLSQFKSDYDKYGQPTRFYGTGATYTETYGGSGTTTYSDSGNDNDYDYNYDYDYDYDTTYNDGGTAANNDDETTYYDPPANEDDTGDWTGDGGTDDDYEPAYNDDTGDYTDNGGGDTGDDGDDGQYNVY